MWNTCDWGIKSSYVGRIRWLGHRAWDNEMVNFMCQHWGCFCIRLTFKRRLSSRMWVGLIQSIEGLNRTSRGTSSVHSLELHLWLCFTSSLLACTADSGIASLQNHGSQFFVINLYFFIYIYTSYWLFLWRTLTTTEICGKLVVEASRKHRRVQYRRIRFYWTSWGT